MFSTETVSSESQPISSSTKIDVFPSRFTMESPARLYNQDVK